MHPEGSAEQGLRRVISSRDFAQQRPKQQLEGGEREFRGEKMLSTAEAPKRAGGTEDLDLRLLTA
jgi:hypothetical protein